MHKDHYFYRDRNCFGNLAEISLQVLRYLQQFDKAFDISKDVRFNTQVSKVQPVQRQKGQQYGLLNEEILDHEWHVRSRDMVRASQLNLFAHSS